MSLTKPAAKGTGSVPSFRKVALTVFLLLVCLSVHAAVRLSPVFLKSYERSGAQGVAGERDGFDASFKTLDVSFPSLKSTLQDPKGRTYFLECDPYAWALRTENVLKFGRPGDKVVEGRDFDSLMLAPEGDFVDPHHFLFYLSGFLYRIFRLVTPVSLHAFLFYLPLAFSLAFFSAFYLFIRRWFSDLPAFLGTFFLGLLPIMIKRSSAGWFDTDMLNLLLIMLVLWAFLEAIWNVLRRGRAAFWIFLSAFFYGLFAVTWIGHWFLLGVCVTTLLFLIGRRLFLLKGSHAGSDPEIRALLGLLGIFLLTVPLVSFCFGVNLFKEVSAPIAWSWITGSIPSSASIWPNVASTISELLPLNPAQLTGMFYGTIPFWVAGIGFLAGVYFMWIGGMLPFLSVFSLWSFFMLAASFRGQRFVFYFAPPFFLLAAVFWGSFFKEYLLSRSKNKLSARDIKAFVILLFLTAGGIFIQKGCGFSSTLRPGMNDGWYNVLGFLRKTAPPNAIMNAWWDYGDWIKYYARRSVIFDNQTQTGQLAYWMSRALISTSEAEAVGILRLLDNASDTTFDKLNRWVQEPLKTKMLMDRLVVADQQVRREILRENGVPVAEAGEILNDFEKTPAPAYLLVEAGMLAKLPSIYRMGRWDYEKYFFHLNRREPEETLYERAEKILGISRARAQQLSEQLRADQDEGKGVGEIFSPGLSFISQSTSMGGKKGWILFDNLISWNPVMKLCLFKKDDKVQSPRRVILDRDGHLQDFGRPEGSGLFDVLIKQRGWAYKAFILDRAISDSLFVKLCFLKGRGLSHFVPVYSEERYQVYVYKIVWDR